MAPIKEVSRSATVAFSPDKPYFAAGTMAGAVDISFSTSANLDIFKLDFQSDDRELPLVSALPSTEPFNRLSWGKSLIGSEEFALGLIAGGLNDGNIGIWNPATLISSEPNEGALLQQLSRHKGPVRGLEYNSISPNLLASGADEGEICIWDIAKPTHFPPLKGSGSATQGEISFLSWNSKVQHILASASFNGTTVVWDQRKQKPVISFSDSVKRRCSVLQWNPDVATQLILASDDDSSPSLRVWDMRNTMSPLKELVGHTKGVVAMSWCPNDSFYLLTCAKDNRTICWDIASSEIVSELPAGTNWNFDVHWYPKIPGVISASSFDGKIGIYNIKGCGRNGVEDGDSRAAGSPPSPISMEKLLNELEDSLKSEMRETRSVLSDQLKEIIGKIDSLKAQEVPESQSSHSESLDPFVLYKGCGLIGEGVSGEVFKVCDRETNEIFAMKCVRIKNNIIPPSLAREISLCYDLQHDNIVKLKKVHSYKSELFLLMEHAGMDLYKFLKDEKRKAEVTTDLLKDWLRQLLSALSYLHRRGIIHRDLKSENIMIGNGRELKISDFGSARRIIDATMLTPHATTLIFMAPEMLMGDQMYGVAVDMWAAGCIFIEMLGEENPFIAKAQHEQGSVSCVLEKIFRKIGKPSKESKLCSLPQYPRADDQEYAEASVLSLVPSLDALGNDLLKQLLAVDPLHRITAEQALNHPFLKQQQQQPVVQPSQQQQPIVQPSQQPPPVEQPVQQQVVHEEQPLEEHKQAVQEEKQQAVQQEKQEKQEKKEKQQAVHEHMRLRPRNRPEGHKKVPEVTQRYTRRLQNKKA